MPAIRWATARKNAREAQNAKKAARQFHNYAMAQYALYATGQITEPVLNARISASFRKQARNSFIAGRRTMGSYNAVSPEDEAALNLLLTLDISDLEGATTDINGKSVGLFSRGNSLYNEYTNAQQATDFAKKILGAEGEDEKKLKDFVQGVAAKGAASIGVIGAERYDQASGYKEGWDRLNTHLDQWGNKVENYAPAGEMNAVSAIPGDAVLVYWHLGHADHCPDCIALSDASPLFLSAMDEQGIFPGSGHTVCRDNCACYLEYETPDQVCGDSMLGDASDPSTLMFESAAGGRLNVYIQEADSCANPVDLSSMDIPEGDPSVSPDEAYNWDGDIQSTFEGDILDTAQTLDSMAAGAETLDAAGAIIDTSAALSKISKMFDFLNSMVPPDVRSEVRISKIKDAQTAYHFAWHEGATAIHLHAGLVTNGPSALEHEFLLRSFAQTSAIAKAKGKAFVIDGAKANPGLRKWLDTLGAEHKFEGASLPTIKPHFPAVYTPPKDLYVPSHITIGVSRARPEMGGAETLAQVGILRENPVIHDAEATTLSDLKSLHVATSGQQEVIGRYTFGAESSGEPSLLVSLDAHKVNLTDVDITGAYLVRRNLQDSTIATFTGDEMKRMGITPNGTLFSVTGLPVNKMQEVYDAVGKLVPVASIDTVHGVVEFSAFEKDATKDVWQGFQKIADQFPDAKFGTQDAHIRWYFHDEATRTATDYLHGPAADLITADEVIAAHGDDLRVLAIAPNRELAGVSGQVAGGVSGTARAAVEGYGLGRPEEDLAALLAQPFQATNLGIGKEATTASAAADQHAIQFKKDFEAWKAHLTPDEAAVLPWYQNGGSDSLNLWLRDPTKVSADLATFLSSTTGTSFDFDKAMAALDGAIGKGAITRPTALSTLKEPTTVFRGISGKFRVPAVGDILSDKAYVSTTLDPAIGVRFAAVLPPEPGETQVVYRYALPAGHSAAYMDGWFSPAFNDEREMLLPRNEAFRVVGVHNEQTVSFTLPITKSGPAGKLITVQGEEQFRKVTVVDLVPDANIEYRKSEEWLKTVKPHFLPPDPATLVLDTSGAKLGGLTAKATYIELGKPATLADLLGTRTLTGIDALTPEMRDVIAPALARVRGVDPGAWERFGGFEVGAMGKSAHYADTNPPGIHFAEKARINLNGDRLGTPAGIKATLKDLKASLPYDEHPTDADLLSRIVVHEYGHVVDGAMKVRPAMKADWEAFWAAHIESPTGYGLKDEGERRAEVFARAMFGATDPQSGALRDFLVAHGGALPGDGTLPVVGETKWLFKPKQAFINDIGLSMDTANVEKTVDYIADMLKVNVKPVEPFEVEFPTGTGATKLTGGNIQKMLDGYIPLDTNTSSPVAVVPVIFKAKELPIPAGNLEEVKALGGSTGAMLVKDPTTGIQYVDKFGNSAAHVREEFATDAAYRAVGVPVTRSVLIDTAKGPMKRAQYIEGTPLDSWWKTASDADKAAMRTQLQASMAMDALMANWDAIGLVGDNILIDSTGTAFRIDNGGSLRYRAQGALKGADFGPKVSELTRYRDTSKNTWITRMYGTTSDAEVRRQVELLDSRRAELLAAIPEDVRPTINARLDDMLAQTKNVVPAVGVPGTWGAAETVRPTLAAVPAKVEVIDTLTTSQMGQVAQQQVFDWLVGNDDAHMGQFLINVRDGHLLGIDKDAAIWELPAQYAAGNNTMADGKSIALNIFQKPTAERLAKLDPAAITAVLNRASNISDAQYIEMFKPLLPALTAHPNAVSLTEDEWMGIILKRKHELRSDVDGYYATKIAAVEKSGIELPPKWQEWQDAGAHFPSETDLTTSLHLETIGPPIPEPAAAKDGVLGFFPMDQQQYMVGGSPIPLNAPIPAWSGHIPDEPPLPPSKAGDAELAIVRQEAHDVFRGVQGVIDGTYPLGISDTLLDSEKAKAAGLFGGKFSGMRIYAKNEADLQPIKDYVAIRGHSSFDAEYKKLIGFSDSDIAKMTAYENAKKGLSLRAGAVVVEPDGRMWVLAPKNEFDGYKNTWIKGGVDGNETTAATAVREVREETGMAIELDGYLGDYVNSSNTSVVRMYVAHRTGGGPLYVGTPKETYKVKLMTPDQAAKNLIRSGKPDPRDQAILQDALLKINGTPGDLTYVVPASDVGTFHAAIALTKSDAAVPSTLPYAVRPINFSPNPVTIEPRKPGVAFGFDPSKVANLYGTEVDYPASSKSFPLNTTVWKSLNGAEQKMYWKPPSAHGVVFWANSKKQLDDPFDRMTVHVAQLRKFGEMFAKDGNLTELSVSNVLLDQVPKLKEMVVGVGAYTSQFATSKLARAQVAKLLEAVKGVPLAKSGAVVRIQAAAHDPVAKVIGRSGVDATTVADHIEALTAVPVPIAVPLPTPSIEDLSKLGIYERKAAFDALDPEVRDAMANAATTVPARVAELVDTLGPRPTFLDAVDNISARDKQLEAAGLVTETGRSAIRNYNFELRDILYQAGVTDKALLNAMVMDTYDSMIAQEVETIGQVLGDHGVRHITGNFDTAWDALKVVPGRDTALTKALLKLSAPLHDMGYLTPTGRAILTSDHPRWGMQAFDVMARPNITKAFGKDAADQLAHIIDTHTADILDWTGDPMGSSFRLADNLALFEKEKLPALIAYVTGNEKVLLDYAEGAVALTKDDVSHGITALMITKASLRDNIYKMHLPLPLRDQLLLAVDAVGPTLPKFTLGMIGAHIGAFGWVDDHITVDLVRGKANEALSKVVDVGQAQFAKFAKSYGLDGQAFVDDGHFLFKNADGKIALEASVVTPAGMLVDKRDILLITSPDTVEMAAALKTVQATGPPNLGETYKWKLPNAVVEPSTGWALTTPTTMWINGTVTHLDGPTQMNVLAATLAKMPIPAGVKEITIGGSLMGASDTSQWVDKTFGHNFGTNIPAEMVKSWKSTLGADLYDLKREPGLLAPIEHAEPVGTGVVSGPLAAQYKFNTDIVASLTASPLSATIGDTGKLTEILTWTAPDGTVAKTLFQAEYATALGVPTGIRWTAAIPLKAPRTGQDAAIRSLHWFGDYFEQHPNLQTLSIGPTVLSKQGATTRALIESFTSGLAKVEMQQDIVLDRSTVLAIRDALDKEIMPHAVPVPLPVAGLAYLLPVDGTTKWNIIGNGWQTATGGSHLAQDSGGMLHYYPGSSLTPGQQMADLAAMHDIAVANAMPIVAFYNLDPEVTAAMESFGASATASSLAMSHDQFVKFSALSGVLTEPQRIAIEAIEHPTLTTASVLATINDKAALSAMFGAAPVSDVILPTYKTYNKGEMQLHKVVYTDGSSMVTRRWGNRIEAWDVSHATSLGQLTYLNQVAVTMEAQQKIAYLRILEPSGLVMSVKTMLMDAGAKEYEGGLRIEQAELLKLRQQMLHDLSAAAAKPVAKVEEQIVLQKIASASGAEGAAVVNALTVSTTVADKDKFVWASYGNADGMSVRVVTREMKTELWWRRVVDGPHSSGIMREQAVLREWVRQGEQFDANPLWLRMRITGLKKLTPEFRDVLTSYGAETVDGDTLHLSREKVLKLRDDIKHDLGMAETKVVAPLAGSDSAAILTQLHTSADAMAALPMPPGKYLAWNTVAEPTIALGYKAVFLSGTNIAYTYGHGLDTKALRLEGAIYGSLDPAKQGAETAAFLFTQSDLAVMDSRNIFLREKFLAPFPELRTQLEGAGALWDNGYLKIDPAMSKVLHEALAQDTAVTFGTVLTAATGAHVVVQPVAVAVVTAAESGVKLSAQMGYDANEMGGFSAIIEKGANGGTYVGRVGYWAALTVEGQSQVVDAPHLPTSSPVEALKMIAALGKGFESGGSLLSAGSMGIKFSSEWLNWAGPSVKDLLTAASAQPASDGSLFMHRAYLSKLAAKITDDIGIDAKVLGGSAAEAAPLVSKPLLVDLLATSAGSDVPADLGMYINNTFTASPTGAERTTHLVAAPSAGAHQGPSYDWRYMPGPTSAKELRLTNSHADAMPFMSLDQLTVANRRGMVAMVKMFGDLAAVTPSIEKVSFDHVLLGVGQTEWLKSFGAKEVGYFGGPLLVMERADLLALHDEIGKQLMGTMTSAVSASVSPNLAAFLAAMKIDDVSLVAKAGAQWTDEVIATGGNTLHKATIGGAVASWGLYGPLDHSGTAIKWMDFKPSPIASLDEDRAARAAVLRSLLSAMEASPEVVWLRVSQQVYVGALEVALKDAGATTGVIQDLNLSRAQALTLKGILDTIPGAGMGVLDAHTVTSVGDATLASAAKLGLPMAGKSTNFTASTWSHAPLGYQSQPFGKAAIAYKFSDSASELQYTWAGAAYDATTVDKMAAGIAVMKEDAGNTSGWLFTPEFTEATGLRAFLLGNGGVMNTDGNIAVAAGTKKAMVAKFQVAAENAVATPVPRAALMSTTVTGELPGKAIDTSAIKAIGAGPPPIYNSEVHGNLFADNFGVPYDANDITGLPQPSNTIAYSSVLAPGFVVSTDSVAAQNHLLADIHSDMTSTPNHGPSSHDAVFDKALLDQTGLKPLLASYGAIDTPVSSDGLFMANAQLKLLAKAIDEDALGGSLAAAVGVIPPIHISVGYKYGFDLVEANGLGWSGISGGKLSKKSSWIEGGGGYSNKSRVLATWSELKGSLRWDGWLPITSYYSTPMSATTLEASAYRQIALMLKRASLEGKGVSVQADVLDKNPKIAALMKGYGAKVKDLGGAKQVAKESLILDPTQTGILDGAIQREKAGAINAATPTMSFTSGQPLSKQGWLFDPAAMATLEDKGTADGLIANIYSSAAKLPGGDWKTTTYESPNPWSASSSPVKSFISYRYIQDKQLGGTSLVVGAVSSNSSSLKNSVLWKRLTELLNDPANPVDTLRVTGLGSSASVFKSLGATYDETGVEWILNKHQTTLLGDAIKEDKVTWDPATGYKAPPSIALASPPSVATISGIPTPVMSPGPISVPIPVPTPVAQGLAATYGYNKTIVDSLTLNANVSSVTKSVGKFGPSLVDDWPVAGDHVKIAWRYDDHKGVRIAHIQSIGGGTVDSQMAALIAHLDVQLLNGHFEFSPLKRVIIDKKALAGMPKAEQLLKDAGWKETKGYYTTDKAGLAKLVGETKDNKATWQTLATLPVTPLAVPIGAGAAVGPAFVMPTAVASKLAKPSFIYGFAKAEVDVAYGGIVSTDLGVLAAAGGNVQTYDLAASGATGKWSVSPSGKTVGWYEFNPTGNAASDANAAMAMLRKIAEDAQNRTSYFWVKPEVYDKVSGLRQLLIDAGGTETDYAKLGVAIQMPAANASKLVAAISSDAMTGLTVSVKTPADYLLYDKMAATNLFLHPPIVNPNGATWDIPHVGTVHAQYEIANKQATWSSMVGNVHDLKDGAAVAAVAQLEWFNEQGIPNILIKKEVLAQLPKLAQFLIASGGKVEAEAIRLDATSLNNVAKFFHHEQLPEALGGAKLAYSVVDDMAAKSSSVIDAIHSLVIEPDGLTTKASFVVAGTVVSTNFVRSQENIYWRSMDATGATSGQARSAAVAQLRKFTTDMAQNANLQRLDVDAKVFDAVPHVKDVLIKYGATEQVAADGSVYWSLNRPRVELLRNAIDKEVGDVLVGPPGYAMDQVRIIKWPMADALTATPISGVASRFDPLLNPLAAEARKYDTFADFSNAYQIDLKHGTYWHVTADKNFVINPLQGPRDMSSGAITGAAGNPGLMVTSDLEHWLAAYTGKERPYVARIDLSALAPDAYKQINRGFGNEFFLSDLANVKVDGTFTRAAAKKIDAAYDAVLPQSESALQVIYDAAHVPTGDASIKREFTDLEGNRWAFRPGESGRVPVTDQAASHLAALMGLPTPAVKLYTLNIAPPGSPEHFVQGSLYKLLPSVKPVILAQLTPLQVQDMLRQSVLDWVIANDDAHAGNLIINAADDKLWSTEKSAAWLNFHGPQDMLNRDATGANGGTPLIFKFFQEAVANPTKLSAIHPSTISNTLRHLQGISDDEFKRIVGPVARAVTGNPLYKNNPDKFLADMLIRKNGAATDFEAFFRTQIKDARIANEAAVPDEWKKWLDKGGVFDLTSTRKDLANDQMVEWDARFLSQMGGVWDHTKAREMLEASAFQPIRRELSTYFGGPVQGAIPGTYGGELIRPNILKRTGMAPIMAEWEDLNHWMLLRIMNGDRGPYSQTMDTNLRQFWNPETASFRLVHATRRYASGTPQDYVDHYTAEGVRDMLSTGVGSHVSGFGHIAGGGGSGVFYYIDTPYEQVFSAKALGLGAEADEVLVSDIRPEQIIAVRKQSNPLDMSQLMAYNGPVVSHNSP